MLHLASLRPLIKRYFSLDHIHYSRWLTVHLSDLLQLKYNFLLFVRHFNNGQFTFQKTFSQFSNMALDQVHEQNNTRIKGSGGATHLVNLSDESPLLRLELDVGELSKLFTDFGSNALPSASKADDFLYIKKHHEDNISFKNRFNKDVELVISCFTINPFPMKNFTPINNTTIHFNGEGSENIGEEQFLTFWTERLILVKEPINKKKSRRISSFYQEVIYPI